MPKHKFQGIAVINDNVNVRHRLDAVVLRDLRNCFAFPEALLPLHLTSALYLIKAADPQSLDFLQPQHIVSESSPAEGLDPAI